MTTWLKIKEMAKVKGISQTKLGRMTGAPANTRKIFHNPTATVNTATLDRYALALGVDVSELIETIHDKQDNNLR